MVAASRARCCAAPSDNAAFSASSRDTTSLVETSSEAGYHVLLFSGSTTGDPEDKLPGYDDLLRLDV